MNIMNKNIGVFDSGIGGLTVLKSLIGHFPNENFIYLGDTARVPYGNKGANTVIRYAIESTEFLKKQDIKLLVVACNTASSVALETLKKTVQIPIIGVVEPSAKEAYAVSKTKMIGVIGTRRTISSAAYTQALKRISSDVKVYGTACPLFVHLVEEGWTDNEVASKTTKIYLDSFKNIEIDVLILGCTHYPLLLDIIKKEIGSKVTLIESGEATAKEVMLIMNELHIANKNANKAQSIRYYVTDDSDGFDRIAGTFLKNKYIKSTFVEL